MCEQLYYNQQRQQQHNNQNDNIAYLLESIPMDKYKNVQ